MLGLAALLPQTLVGVSPPPGGCVGNLDQELARRGIQNLPLVGEAVSSVQQLTVDINLTLVPGAVTDSYRTAVAPPREMGQRALGQISLSADSEHDLQVGASAQLRGRRSGHVGEEVGCLVGARCYPQRLESEARVAHPRIAIVPVALSAHFLRQRGGRGGHDGPGRLVSQGLQHTAAGVNEILPRSLVALMNTRPRLPPANGVVYAGHDLLLAPHSRLLFPALLVMQCKGNRLTFRH